MLPHHLQGCARSYHIWRKEGRVQRVQQRFFSLKDNEIADAKPYTHLLLQAGYSPTSPRALVKISDVRVKLPEDTEPQSAIGKAMYAEAKAEGFELDDAWIGIALGAVVHSE